MKQKMRIQLKDPNGVVLSDRLVDQYTETLNGPTESHNGAFCIEFNFFDQEDVIRGIEYLNKLIGKIPIEKRVRVAGSTKTSVKVTPYQEILKDIKSLKTIEEIIDALYKLDFRFVHYQFLQELEVEGKLEIPWAKEIHKKYQWLVRMAKIAKDPINDKYDFTLMVGIRFFDTKSDKVIIYYPSKYKGTLTREWKTKWTFNMKEKKQTMIFPKYMTLEERKRWRVLERKQALGRPLTQGEQKFHARYSSEIWGMNPHIEKPAKNIEAE